MLVYIVLIIVSIFAPMIGLPLLLCWFLWDAFVMTPKGIAKNAVLLKTQYNSMKSNGTPTHQIKKQKYRDANGEYSKGTKVARWMLKAFCVGLLLMTIIAFLYLVISVS